MEKAPEADVAQKATFPPDLARTEKAEIVTIDALPSTAGAETYLKEVREDLSRAFVVLDRTQADGMPLGPYAEVPKGKERKMLVTYDKELADELVTYLNEKRAGGDASHFQDFFVETTREKPSSEALKVHTVRDFRWNYLSPVTEKEKPREKKKGWYAWLKEKFT